MNNGKLIKIDRVIEKIYRDYGFNDIDWINCVEWIGECLDFIGAPRTYIEKFTDGVDALDHPDVIDIENSRGELPCDLYQIIQVFKKSGEDLLPMREATDTTIITYDTRSGLPVDDTYNYEHTYRVQNNYIFTSFKDGEVSMAYRANPTDDRGFPMVPDNVKFIAACAAYCADKMLLKMEIQGKPISPRVATKIEQDVSWYISAADSSSRIPTIDEMESWKNNFLKLIPNINSHNGAFRDDGRMERRYNGTHNNLRDNRR